MVRHLQPERSRFGRQAGAPVAVPAQFKIDLRDAPGGFRKTEAERSGQHPASQASGGGRTVPARAGGWVGGWSVCGRCEVFVSREGRDVPARDAGEGPVACAEHGG